MRQVIAQFVLEARRRGLLKVATAYLIVTWLVLEIGHTLFLVFDLPHQALQFIFVLLALGFPVVLLGVWQGWFGAPVVQAVVPTGETHASAHHEGPWLAMVFGAVALFAVAVAIGVRFFGMGNSGASHATVSQAAASHDLTTPPATAETLPAFNPPAHSIAVLPFVNMSGDPQQEYFSDGLAEELLNSLVRISELKVAAAFSLKGKNVEAGDIARRGERRHDPPRQCTPGGQTGSHHRPAGRCHEWLSPLVADLRSRAGQHLRSAGGHRHECRAAVVADAARERHLTQAHAQRRGLRGLLAR
jgi:hypothetical protein